MDPSDQSRIEAKRYYRPKHSFSYHWAIGVIERSSQPMHLLLPVVAVCGFAGTIMLSDYSTLSKVALTVTLVVAVANYVVTRIGLAEVLRDYERLKAMGKEPQRAIEAAEPGATANLGGVET